MGGCFAGAGQSASLRRDGEARLQALCSKWDPERCSQGKGNVRMVRIEMDGDDAGRVLPPVATCIQFWPFVRLCHSAKVPCQLVPRCGAVSGGAIEIVQHRTHEIYSKIY